MECIGDESGEVSGRDVWNVRGRSRESEGLRSKRSKEGEVGELSK